MSGSVAAWTAGGWRFVPPVDGMVLYERVSGTCTTYRNGSWELGTLRASSLVIGGQQVAGQRRPAIESPSGGSVVDAEGRGAIASILDALRQHGLIET